MNNIHSQMNILAQERNAYNISLKRLGLLYTEPHITIDQKKTVANTLEMTSCLTCNPLAWRCSLTTSTNCESPSVDTDINTLWANTSSTACENNSLSSANNLVPKYVNSEWTTAFSSVWRRSKLSRNGLLVFGSDTASRKQNKHLNETFQYKRDLAVVDQHQSIKSWQTTCTFTIRQLPITCVSPLLTMFC